MQVFDTDEDGDIIKDLASKEEVSRRSSDRKLKDQGKEPPQKGVRRNYAKDSGTFEVKSHQKRGSEDLDIYEVCRPHFGPE